MTTIQKKSLKVGKQVTTEHVNTIVKNYKQERWIHNSNRIGMEDSMSAWYSIEELEEFIAKSKDHGADGIRMYFGVYGKDYTEKPLHAGRQTIALVATKHKETPKGESDKDIYINTENGTTLLAWNASNICPPYCGTKDDFGEDNGFGIGTMIDNGDDGLIIA